MNALEILVLVLAAVLALCATARRIGVLEPVVLLVGGVLLGLIPAVGDIHLSPDIVLLLFLPAILYWESLTTSLREIRANLRVVILLATVLVLLTALAVASVVHEFLDLDWPTAFVMGAVVAPTDAAAVAAVAYLLPRRAMTILRAESLVNDGTALALFAVAIAVATGEEQLSWTGASIKFALSYAGGFAIGLVTAAIMVWIRRRLHDSILENVASILTPFAAYLLADWLEVSGVLAVVTCGLTLARFGPRLVAARSRVQAYAFWDVTTFTLNAALFVLLGTQLPGAMRGLESHTVAQGVLGIALASVAVVGTRLIWNYTTPYAIRALDRRPGQRLRRVGARQRFPLAWAGVRGGISLAAALAVPAVTSTGEPFADRDLIVFMTGGVIVVTLLGQGLTLPRVIRWAHFPPDDADVTERRIAEQAMTAAALDELPVIADRLGVDQGVRDHVRRDLIDSLEDLEQRALAESHTGEATDEDRTDSHLAGESRLRTQLVAVKRRTMVALRDRGEIDDSVLRRLEAVLDAEEVQLTLGALR